MVGGLRKQQTNRSWTWMWSRLGYELFQGLGWEPEEPSLQSVSTDNSDWSQLHSSRADNSYKTMPAVFFSFFSSFFSRL